MTATNNISTHLTGDAGVTFCNPLAFVEGRYRASRARVVMSDFSATPKPLTAHTANNLLSPISNIRDGESIVPGSARLSVKSSNGASANLQIMQSSVAVDVNLRSGPGFDQRRAWIAGDVTAIVRSPVNLSPVAPGEITLRVPGRRQVYSQPVPEGSIVHVSTRMDRLTI